jgi:hypothetical protein
VGEEKKFGFEPSSLTEKERKIVPVFLVSSLTALFTYSANAYVLIRGGGTLEFLIFIPSPPFLDSPQFLYGDIAGTIKKS